jgi:S1-C subfamily serine protease
MSDPGSPEIQRFEPLPDQRHHRRAAFDGVNLGRADAVTPERWFEPGPSLHESHEGEPLPVSSRGYGRGVVAVLFATSLVGAILGAGGTYMALRTSGALDSATAAPAAAGGQRVSIESDTSTVIAAVNGVSPAVVQIVTLDAAGGTGVGSGILYDSRGWILTNKHVVEGAKTITVRLKDDRQRAGTVYGLDTLTDLAIVKIDGLADLAVAPIGDSSSLQVGELAIAIGSPLGLQYPDSVTVGIISALDRDIAVASDDPSSTTTTNLHGLIQTDAAINPGNSGGPLVDASGRVVGVTTAEAQTAQGIGFAIPIDIAKPIMQQALAGEKLSRPFIGVSYDTINRGLKEQYSLPLDEGAWVHKEDATGNSIEAVTAGSPGEAAGIKTGDIITEAEGQAIDQAHQLADVLVQYAPGRTVSVEIYRKGAYLTLAVTLGTRPASAS